MTLAPAFSSDLSPNTRATIGVSGVTTMVFSPPLYFRVSLRPSFAVTIWSTVALVMVLLGRMSHGRKPSELPRNASGNSSTDSACWVPSGCGIAATAT